MPSIKATRKALLGAAGKLQLFGIQSSSDDGSQDFSSIEAQLAEYMGKTITKDGKPLMKGSGAKSTINDNESTCDGKDENYLSDRPGFKSDGKDRSDDNYLSDRPGFKSDGTINDGGKSEGKDEKNELLTKDSPLLDLVLNSKVPLGKLLQGMQQDVEDLANRVTKRKNAEALGIAAPPRSAKTREQHRLEDLVYKIQTKVTSDIEQKAYEEKQKALEQQKKKTNEMSFHMLTDAIISILKRGHALEAGCMVMGIEGAKKKVDANKPDGADDIDKTRPKANYPIRRRGEAAASSDNNAEETAIVLFDSADGADNLGKAAGKNNEKKSDLKSQKHKSYKEIQKEISKENEKKKSKLTQLQEQLVSMRLIQSIKKSLCWAIPALKPFMGEEDNSERRVITNFAVAVKQAKKAKRQEIAKVKATKELLDIKSKLEKEVEERENAKERELTEQETAMVKEVAKLKEIATNNYKEELRQRYDRRKSSKRDRSQEKRDKKDKKDKKKRKIVEDIVLDKDSFSNGPQPMMMSQGMMQSGLVMAPSSEIMETMPPMIGMPQDGQMMMPFSQEGMIVQQGGLLIPTNDAMVMPEGMMCGQNMIPTPIGENVMQDGMTPEGMPEFLIQVPDDYIVKDFDLMQDVSSLLPEGGSNDALQEDKMERTPQNHAIETSQIHQTSQNLEIDDDGNISILDENGNVQSIIDQEGNISFVGERSFIEEEQEEIMNNSILQAANGATLMDNTGNSFANTSSDSIIHIEMPKLPQVVEEICVIKEEMHTADREMDSAIVMCEPIINGSLMNGSVMEEPQMICEPLIDGSMMMPESMIMGESMILPQGSVMMPDGSVMMEHPMMIEQSVMVDEQVQPVTMEQEQPMMFSEIQSFISGNCDNNSSVCSASVMEQSIMGGEVVPVMQNSDGIMMQPMMEPNMSVMYSDGSVIHPDGSVVNPDGNVCTPADGSGMIQNTDGSG